MDPRRTVVQDLGSNSFRMVVYEWEPGQWWRRSDQLSETVRIGKGLDSTGRLGEEGIDRGLKTVELFDHARRAFGIDEEDTIAVATSAIRDAENGPEFLAQAEALGSVPIRVLSTAEEARYGMLAAVNATTLVDGWTLDIGGGSLQLCRVEGRRSVRAGSWPLGAVRMTEHFLARDGDGPAKRSSITSLAEHAAEALHEAGIADEGGRMIAVGGAIRTRDGAATPSQGATIRLADTRRLLGARSSYTHAAAISAASAYASLSAGPRSTSPSPDMPDSCRAARRRSDLTIKGVVSSAWACASTALTTSLCRSGCSRSSIRAA